MAGTQKQPRVSEISFKFDVPNVSTLKSIWSPEFYVYGVLWQIAVDKEDKNGKPWLTARLFCVKNMVKKDKSTQWKHVAFPTFKLLSFANNVNECN